jgi:tol-pal system protein YbgF
MRLITLGISLAGLLVVAGCASRGEMEILQRDTDEMKTRIVQMEKDLRLAEAQQKELDTLRKGTADLQATLESARVDMQVLTGKVDDAALLAKKPTDDLNLLREDMERRFASLDERMAKLEKGLSDTAAKEEKSPEALYQKGLETFRNGDMPKAREQFSRFLELYPNHDLTANARYWLGETYFGEKKYDQAILEFQEVIKKFPGKEKVPAAMLKQALAFKELGDVKSARYVLKKLIEDFPLADEVKPAKEKLKEMK